jgi:hypothetical protein
MTTGQTIDWNPLTGSGRTVEITGRSRFLAAQKRDNADRGQAVRPNLTLSDPDWSEVIGKVRREAERTVAPSAKVRPVPEDVARRVIAALGFDGTEVGASQTAIRRAIISAAVERWNAEQLRRPGPRGPAEYAQFKSDIAAALAAAAGDKT